jgi:subtilase family serine protease
MSTHSAPAAVPAVKSLGAADQSAVAHFNMYLPLTHTAALEQLLQSQTDSTSPNYHHWLTPGQFKQQFGPSPHDVARARALLQSEGFSIVSEKTQSLEVEGPVSHVERLFNTRLQRVQMKQGRIKLAAAEGHLTLPQSLAAMGAVIPEFTTHLAAHVHSRVLRPVSAAFPLFRLSSNDSFFYPNDLNEAYQLPSFRTEVTPPFSRHPAQIAGVGAHIGIVISSIINPADLANTFNSSIDLGGGLSLTQA